MKRFAVQCIRDDKEYEVMAIEDGSVILRNFETDELIEHCISHFCAIFKFKGYTEG